MIVSFSGKKGSGKDTAADAGYFRNFTRLSFARDIKQMCSDVFQRDIKWFYDLKDSNFEQAVVIDPDCLSRLYKVLGNPAPDKTVVIYEIANGKRFSRARELLQFVGTDIIRNIISEQFFLDKIRKTISSTMGVVPYVITDTRFPNELDMLKSLGAICILIKRPGTLEDSHASENALSDDQFDHVFENNGTIADLHAGIERLL